MNKIWRVAKNEYLNIVRTKAFIISVVLMPVFMGGAILVQELLKDKVDLRDKRFAVVDKTGRLYPRIEQAAAQRPTRKDGKPVLARFVPEESDAEPRALSDRVRKGELLAYVVVGEGVLEGTGEVAYHTLTPTYDALPNWLRNVLASEVRRVRFEQANLDPKLVAELSRPTPLSKYGLVEVTQAGEVKQAKKVDKVTTYGVPAGAMFLLFMLVMTSAPLLLNTVLEEKIQRISEILVASVSPFELFLGKLCGIVLVAWTLSCLYLGGVAYVAAHFGVAGSIPVSVYFWFLFFQLLALLIFGAMFSALGAAASELRDAQSMMMPAMLLVMIPMFVWLPVMKQPDSAFATWVSLFPPATPFLLLMRIAIPPGPAAWEIALGVALTVAFTLLIVWAAGRVFRVGILAQGQAPSFRKMLAWIRSR